MVPSFSYVDRAQKASWQEKVLGGMLLNSIGPFALSPCLWSNGQTYTVQFREKNNQDHVFWQEQCKKLDKDTDMLKPEQTLC